MMLLRSVLVVITWIVSADAYSVNFRIPVGYQTASISSMSSLNDKSNNFYSQDEARKKSKKGKLLVLGGTGFLGRTICKRAILEGYQVVSLSRRGYVDDGDTVDSTMTTTVTSKPPIDFRIGDARNKDTIRNILAEDNDEEFTGVIHCIGLLFDDSSGLGQFNSFVSGSGSIPDKESTYDTITRLTAFNAIDASLEYALNNKNKLKEKSFPLPFCFISAAEAGWPDVPGGKQIENALAPKWLQRYLVAKRTVESKLMEVSSVSSTQALRPIIFRPSLIYSLDRPQSYAPVAAFFVGNAIGLPFVDKPMTVQALACAIVRSMDRDYVCGIQRYPEVEQLNL
jgi:NAD dependent epimerase/dehydratase family